MKSRDRKKAAAKSAAAAAEASHNVMDDAVAKAAVILADAQKRVVPILADAQKRVGPYANEARTRTADFASKRLDAWEPHIKDALDKVTPAVDAARDKVTDDYLPKLQHLLHEAADHPVAVETRRRGKATTQALKGELEPTRPKKSKWKGFGKFLAIAAIGAGAIAAVRHFLTPKDDGWTAHEPSRAYVNNNATFSAPASEASGPADDSSEDSSDEGSTTSDAHGAPGDANPVQRDEDNVQIVSEDEVPVNVDQTAEGTAPDSDQPVESVEGSAAFEGHGEGSYMGDNPPEGYTIKGNERSKKYHVPGGSGYDRTIAEVWFDSEEAAERAGFSKAQR